MVQFSDEEGRSFYRTAVHSLGEDEDGEERYTSSTSTDRLEVVLNQPVLGCLSRERLRASLRTPGLMGVVAPIRNDLELSVAPFEESAVLRYRQALSLGYLSACLIEATGQVTEIPANFWRGDAARLLVTESLATRMEIDGKELHGHVIVHSERLREGWFEAFRKLPADALLAEAELWGEGRPSALLGTPGEVFLQKIAEELCYVNGEPKRWNLSLEHIEAWILYRWDENTLGKYRAGSAKPLARIIVRPKGISAGRPPTEINQQRIEWVRHYEKETGLKYEAPH